MRSSRVTRTRGVPTLDGGPGASRTSPCVWDCEFATDSDGRTGRFRAQTALLPTSWAKGRTRPPNAASRRPNGRGSQRRAPSYGQFSSSESVERRACGRGSMLTCSSTVLSRAVAMAITESAAP